MTFVTAELGANWYGDFEVLDKMVERCASAGVDAVKFQALSQELIDRHPELPYYKECSVTPDNVKLIDHICRDYNMEWFASVCYPEAVKFLDPYVNRYKVRYADSTNDKILAAVGPTGKDILISTSRPPDVDASWERYIYCIPKYPTEWGEINFKMIPKMDGYSNHCLNPLACLKAVRMGAKYLEFHLSDNKDTFAIDNKVSLSYSEMEELMLWIRK